MADTAERTTTVRSPRSTYTVRDTPCEVLAPVTLCVLTGSAYVQDYLTPDQARALGGALIAEADAADGVQS